MSVHLRSLRTWLLVGSCLLGGAIAPAVAAPRSVVILTAESPELVGGVIIRQSLVAALNAGGADPVEVFEETIDTTRFAGSDYDAKLAALYRAKYASAPPALVITIAKPALDFVLRHQDELFRNVPLLFGFVDQRDVHGRPSRPNVAGVLVEVEARATIELARKLHPGSRQVVLVGGTSPFDRAWMSVVRQDLRRLEPDVSFSYLTDLPFDRLLADVSALRDQTIVLFVSMTLDGDGVARVPAYVAALLRQAANVPLYGMASSFLGRGVVGGVMLDLRRHGTDLGLRARRILDGKRAGDLPLITTQNLLAFDARELKRFGIDESRLPAGATVVNREPTLWDLHKRTILATGAVLFGQFLLIGYLLVQHRRRRRAERALHALSGQLLSAQEDERRRIARELHDNVAQRMALLTIGMEQVMMRPARSSEGLVRAMRDLSQWAAEISTEIHNLSHQLHSSKLETLGLAAALRGHCQELLTQGVQARFHDENVPRSLSADVALCLFRVAQEGLNNVVKHSGAREAHVTLRAKRDMLLLTIADRGCGFDEAVVTAQDGLGLASMRERMRLLEGEFTVHSTPGQGTTIMARVPIGKVDAKTASRTVNVA